MSTNSFIDKKEDVEIFLSKCFSILCSNDFNMDRNFYLQVDRQHYIGHYTNRATMVELGYNLEDVVEEIKSLKIEDYLETLIDKKEGTEKNFYCFIKYIQSRQVYIKIKIAEKNDNQIFCVSFHFAEYSVAIEEFPYKN